jgi:hypothetical protein
VFISPAYLVKGGTVAKESGAFNAPTSLGRTRVWILWSRSWKGLCQECGWELNVGKFAQEQHAEHISRLGNIHVRKIRGLLEERYGDGGVGSKAQLAEEMSHAKALK